MLKEWIDWLPACGSDPRQVSIPSHWGQPGRQEGVVLLSRQHQLVYSMERYGPVSQERSPRVRRLWSGPYLLPMMMMMSPPLFIRRGGNGEEDGVKQPERQPGSSRVSTLELGRRPLTLTLAAWEHEAAKMGLPRDKGKVLNSKVQRFKGSMQRAREGVKGTCL